MEEYQKKENEVRKVLDEYGDIRYKVDGLKSAKKTAIESILAKYPEVQKELSEIEDEFSKTIENAELAEKAFRKKVDRLLEEFSQVIPIKDELEFKSDLVKVKYTKEISYDSKALDGFSLENPKLLSFRSEKITRRVELIKK